MRNTLITAAVAGVLLFASCQNSGSGNAAATDSTAAPVETKQERNKKVVMASNEAMMKKDIDGMFKYGADSGFVDYGDGSMPPMTNRDSIKQMMNMWMSAFSDFKGENLQYYADGDNVIVYGEYSGTWTGDMMGQKANGKSFKTTDVDIFTLNEEGKITSHRNIQNWGAVMAMQLGVKMW